MCVLNVTADSLPLSFLLSGFRCNIILDGLFPVSRCRVRIARHGERAQKVPGELVFFSLHPPNLRAVLLECIPTNTLSYHMRTFFTIYLLSMFPCCVLDDGHVLFFSLSPAFWERCLTCRRGRNTTACRVPIEGSRGGMPLARLLPATFPR